MSDTKSKPAEPASGIASPQENHTLQHTRGGVTTRDDATDLGVPMLPGSPDEPQGPEDALGPGPKRGDYRTRIGPEHYQPHEIRPAPQAQQDDPNQPSVVVEAQRPRTAERGDVPGLKGGVETDDARGRRR